ncbi:hypothetical protein GCM10020000_31180 [Streptomyces olivoverticillatus]
MSSYAPWSSTRTPKKAAVLGLKLNAADAALTKAAEALRVHMGQVEWEGEGGEAFRTWSADFVNAILRVGKLSGTAGEWMGHAVQTLHEVHGQMPEVSSSARATLDAYLNNHKGQVGAVAPPLQGDQSGSTLQSGGPTQKQAYEAQQQLETDRTRAAQLMKKLAESYSWSAHNIGVAERPTLKALPGQIVAPDPRNPVDGSGYIQPAGSSSPQADTSNGGSSAATASPAESGRDHEAGRLVPLAEDRGEALPRRRAGTEIDSATPLPTLPSNPPASHVSDPSGSGRVNGQVPLPTFPVPPLGDPGQPRSHRRPLEPSGKPADFPVHSDEAGDWCSTAWPSNTSSTRPGHCRRAPGSSPVGTTCRSDSAWHSHWRRSRPRSSPRTSTNGVRACFRQLGRSGRQQVRHR